MTVIAFYSKGTSIEVQNTWSKRLKFYYPSLKLVPLLSEEAKFATVALLWKAPLNYLNRMTRIKGLISLGQGVDHILNESLIPESIFIRGSSFYLLFNDDFNSVGRMSSFQI